MSRVTSLRSVRVGDGGKTGASSGARTFLSAERPRTLQVTNQRATKARREKSAGIRTHSKRFARFGKPSWLTEISGLFNVAADRNVRAPRSLTYYRGGNNAEAQQTAGNWF